MKEFLKKYWPVVLVSAVCIAIVATTKNDMVASTAGMVFVLSIIVAITEGMDHD